MYLVIMSIALQMSDCLLPIRSQDVFVLPGKALVNLAQHVSGRTYYWHALYLH